MASTPVWRAFDSNLIDSVRSKRVLYNTRLKEFRNNKIKENAWKAVAAKGIVAEIFLLIGLVLPT